MLIVLDKDVVLERNPDNRLTSIIRNNHPLFCMEYNHAGEVIRYEDIQGNVYDTTYMTIPFEFDVMIFDEVYLTKDAKIYYTPEDETTLLFICYTQDNEFYQDINDGFDKKIRITEDTLITNKFKEGVVLIDGYFYQIEHCLEGPNPLKLEQREITIFLNPTKLPCL